MFKESYKLSKCPKTADSNYGKCDYNYEVLSSRSEVDIAIARKIRT